MYIYTSEMSDSESSALMTVKCARTQRYICQWGNHDYYTKFVSPVGVCVCE